MTNVELAIVHYDGNGDMPFADLVVDALRLQLKFESRIEYLREMVWSFDIPSPTTPEYAEHHEAMQVILQFIDNHILRGLEDAK
jgi:hypothetical protein